MFGLGALFGGLGGMAGGAMGVPGMGDGNMMKRQALMQQLGGTPQPGAGMQRPLQSMMQGMMGIPKQPQMPQMGPSMLQGGAQMMGGSMLKPGVDPNALPPEQPQTMGGMVGALGGAAKRTNQGGGSAIGGAFRGLF